MRILLTVHQFLPEHSSGTEILTFKTAKELQSRGHEVRIVTATPPQENMLESERFDSYIHDGLQIDRFYYSSGLSRKQHPFEAEYNNLFFADWFEHHLGYWRPDIVHFFHLWRLSASPIYVCTKLKIPTVMTPTDFWVVCPTNQLRLPDGSFCRGPNSGSVNCVRHILGQSSGLSKIDRIVKRLPDWVVRILLILFQKGIFPEKRYSAFTRAITSRIAFMKGCIDRVDRILVPTQLMKDILTVYASQLEHILYVPYGIDTSDINHSVRKVSDETLRFGFIGTLSEHKGVHLLLESVCRLLPNLPIQLKVYGDLDHNPNYVSELYNISKDDSRIHFCGTFPNSEIGKVLSELDVLVVPSIWYENTPLVVASAQAAGCPVIASNVGGIAEAIQHEVNGLLFEMGNVSELADSILRLDQDRSLLNRLSKRTIPPPSIQQYADELELVYRELISGLSKPKT